MFPCVLDLFTLHVTHHVTLGFLNARLGSINEDLLLARVPVTSLNRGRTPSCPPAELHSPLEALTWPDYHQREANPLFCMQTPHLPISVKAAPSSAPCHLSISGHVALGACLADVE